MTYRQCISSIMNAISESNMADLDFLNTEIKPIICGIDDNGKEMYAVYMGFYDSMWNKVLLSEAGGVGNLLLFTAFDGYLENMY